LKELKSAGILTNEEFESKKTEILKVAPLELSDDPVERLAQLGELRGYGILTTAEFESMKAEILTLSPIGLVAGQAHAAAEVPRRNGRPVLVTLAVLVAIVIIWRILVSGRDNDIIDEPEPVDTVAEPATESETELRRGYCFPDPCVPLGVVDPYTSPGPEGVGSWVTVRAERSEF